MAGEVSRLDAPVIPHMGWNTVTAAADSVLFAGLDAATRFYFVHSYAAQRWDGSANARLGWSTHHSRFLAAVEDGPLAATQFHPEKAAMPVRSCCATGSPPCELGSFAVALILLPAVDVVEGRAVRLVQGKAGSETEYGSALDAARAGNATARSGSIWSTWMRRSARQQPRTARRGGRAP